MDSVIDWMVTTPLSSLLVTSGWAWPLAEAVHFTGLVLIAGTVGLFDLRVLGLGKGLAPATVHRLVPWGVFGLGLSVVTGTLFVFATPDQYFYNSAFHWKVVCLSLMAANAGFFYLRPFAEVRSMGPGDDAPGLAKFCAAASLTLLVIVMYCGRMLTFFRPPGGL